MGMSSSQARLLNLTARMHQIEYKAAKLEAQKLQMANESRRVYENYLNALDARKIQYKFIKADGALDYKDATLASLENGAVSSYASDTSDNIYLLYDNTENKVLVTPEFAAEYGITESSTPETGTLEEWLYSHGCTKAPVPDTYSASAGLSNVENIQAGTSYATPTGTAPSVSSVAPSNVPIADYTNILKTSDPNKTYTVSNANDLNKLRQIINNGAETDGVTIVLTSSFTAPPDWTSIGEFSGTFNGNGYTIGALTNSLFTHLNEGSTVTNLGISGAIINVPDESTVGILADDAQGATIEDVLVTNGKVTAKERVGGLVGNANNSSISYCSVVGTTVTASGIDAGGLIGHCENSTGNILYCSATGSVNGVRRIGGLIGYGKNLQIMFSKSNCNVHSTATNGNSSDSGGFIGSINSSSIQYCESSGSITAENSWSVAGFVGCTSGSTSANVLNITRCKTDCTVTLNGHDSNSTNDNNYATFIGDGKGSVISYSNSLNNSYTFIGGDKNSGVQAQITNCYQSGGISSREGSGSYSSAAAPVEDVGATAFSNPNLQHNAVTDPATSVSSISLTNHTQGSLTVNASNDKLCKYIAYTIGSGTNYDSNYDALNGHYNVYDLAELVELAKTGNYSSISDLTSALTHKYNATDYQLNQTDTCTYGISTGSNPDVKSVSVSSVSDIVTRLAYDIWYKNGSGNIDQIKTQLSSAFNNTQLASLSYYYGKSEWNTIVNTLAGGISASAVSAYTNRYDSTWTINYSPTNNVQITTEHHPDEWVKDDNYYTQYNKYYQLKAMEGYSFKIVDSDLCKKIDFVSNFLDAGASLLTFGLNSDGSFNFEDASVATETSLREVADETDLKKAEAQYEADMRRIDAKDRRYDTELASLDTERNAIKQEMDTLKTVAKDNVERTFKLFG